MAGMAAPVSAAPAPNNYGSTVTCRYQVTDGDQLLNKLVVTPPTILAKHGTQQVGWRFVVRRSLDRWNTPWVVTYRSNVQKRHATTSTPADFDTMRVRVNVPNNVENQQHVWYKVTLNIFWYTSDGSVGSTASSKFTDYSTHVAGEDGTSDLYCAGLAS
jgi:hypothetical protein